MRENKVPLHHKAIFALCQAPLLLNHESEKTLKKLGFISCLSNPCLYKKCSNKILTILAVYVSDMILASMCSNELNKIKTDLSEIFKMSAVEEVNLLLGMEVQASQKLITMSQRRCIFNVVDKSYKFDYPCEPLFPAGITASNAPVFEETHAWYHRAIRLLQYLYISTRQENGLSCQHLAKGV
jgi:Reverse transcriptase (RNA-dependent DNA polymerase)